MVDELAGALDGVRVLDLTTEMGQYAGKLLADLGADVINVEPPGGDAARGVGPFFHDQVGRETSLSYWYFNTNKRSVTCDLDQHDGQHLLRELAKTADIVLESFPPGQMDERDVGYEALKAGKADLVYVTISGFGLTGPHAHWQATDIVGLAMSGILTLAGHPEDPPNQLYGNQGYIVASIAAAQGALLALFHKERRGEGQLVEASLQEALSICQETAMQTWDLQKISRERSGELLRMPGFGAYQSNDGYIYSMVGVPGFGAPWTTLLEWMLEEGKAQDLTEPQYAEALGKLDMRTLTKALTDPSVLAALAPVMERAQEVIAAFYGGKSSQECYEQGQARRLLIGAVSTPQDLLESVQFNARDWFVTLPHAGEAVRYPGPPYRLSETPVRYRRPAPAIGEHNLEVWVGEAGIPRADLPVYASEGAL